MTKTKATSTRKVKPQKKKITTTAPKLKPTPRKFPSRLIVKVENCKLESLIELYDGSLPQINGRKYRYPKPDEPEKWRKLYAAALTYQNKMRYCRINGFEPPKCAYERKYQYLLFHGPPSKIKDRHQRNLDRRLRGLKKGDSEIVHHFDAQDMTTAKSVKLTKCQHARMHGKLCERDKKNGTKTPIPKRIAEIHNKIHPDRKIK